MLSFPAACLLLLSLLMMEEPECSLPGMTKAELHHAEAGVPTGLKAQRRALQFKDIPEKLPVVAEAAHINIPGSARQWEIPATVSCISYWRVFMLEYHKRSRYLCHVWRSYSAALGAIWKNGTFEKSENQNR